MKYLKEKALLAFGLIILPIFFAILTNNIIASYILSIIVTAVIYFVPPFVVRLMENEKLNKWVDNSYVARKISVKFISRFCYIGLGIGIVTLIFLIFENYKFLCLICSLYIFAFFWMSVMCLIMNYQLKKLKNENEK